MDKLDLLFDPRQFADAFDAATGDSSTVIEESQPGAQRKVAPLGAELSCNGQKAVHDVRLKRREK